jgi:hypothetical protein
MADGKVVGTQIVDGLEFVLVEKEYRDGEVKGLFRYARPADALMFQKWVAGMAEDTLVARKVFDRWDYATDLKERAAQREGTATVLPVVRFKKYGDVNLVDGIFGKGLGDKAAVGETPWAGEPLALTNRLAFINATVQMAEAKMEEPGAKVRKAREELLAKGIAKAGKNGLLPA